jgi:RNA polymerase sigma-70 factor (ECF subfamily)
LNSELQAADGKFLDLVNGNRPKILKICRVYAWNREDQEDLHQEILFQIWRGLPHLRENSYADTWLYRTALNTAISFLRKRASRHARTVPCEDEHLRQLAETQDGGSPEPEAQLAALYEAIAQLDGVEKALITLFLEDLSYEQIAQVMGLNSSHVGVLLHRVKKKLSTMIKEKAQ